jgi:glycosyltransferase involved in cell wall biosynthesis
MEADRITGPAKNLLRFGVLARDPEPGLPPVELLVAAFQRGPGPAPPNQFLEAARERGLQPHEIVEQRRFDWAAVERIRRLVAATQPDIVQTHNTKSHLLVRHSGCWRSRPWIAFHHGHTTENLKVRLYNQVDRWSLRTPRLVVTMCRPFEQKLIGMGIPAGRIVILPNQVEAPRPLAGEELDHWRRKLHLACGEQVLLAVGRLSSEKGHAVLLQALQQVRLRNPEISWRLLVAGDGIEAPNLRRQAQAAGLADRVDWLGLLPDVRVLYALAGVFVLPSLSEGSPNVLLEAMAAGCPIVSTNVGGVPESVTHRESALLVPPGQSAPLAQAITALLQDRGLAAALGRAAEARSSDFTPRAFRRRLSGYYQRLLAPA